MKSSFRYIILILGGIFVFGLCGCADEDSAGVSAEFAVEAEYEQGPLAVTVRVTKDEISIAETFTLELEAAIEDGYEVRHLFLKQGKVNGSTWIEGTDGYDMKDRARLAFHGYWSLAGYDLPEAVRSEIPDPLCSGLGAQKVPAEFCDIQGVLAGGGP